MMTDGRISQDEFEKIMSTAKQDYHEADIRAGRVGSLMVQNPEKCNGLQKIAMEESRLGIPLLFGLDVIHGFRTVYPIAIAEAEHIPAILECWHRGVQMGNAVADLVFGAVNPQGRLSVSFPQMTGQCPIYYNHMNTGRPGGKSKFTSRYLDMTEKPESSPDHPLS